MGTFNSNILPATDGLNLGSPDQKWDAFIQTLVGDTWQSSSLLVAQSGNIRLASSDTIAWRNDADDSDIVIAKDSSDIFSLTSFLKLLGLISLTPGSSSQLGFIRLNKADTIYIRNNADTADIPFLLMDTSDIISIGSASGIKVSRLTSPSIHPAASGLIRLGNLEYIKWRNLADSSDYGITVDSTDAVSADSPNGITLTGANAAIRLGGSTSTFPMFKHTGTTINARLADDSDNAAFIAGALTFDTISSSGSPLVDLSSQGASIGSTDITSLPLGLYAIFYYLSISVAATSSSSIVATFSWQSGDGPGQATLSTATLSSNTLADFKSGVFIARLTLPTLSYYTTYASSGATPMLYHLTFKAIRIS